MGSRCASMAHWESISPASRSRVSTRRGTGCTIDPMGWLAASRSLRATRTDERTRYTATEGDALRVARTARKRHWDCDAQHRVPEGHSNARPQDLLKSSGPTRSWARPAVNASDTAAISARSSLSTAPAISMSPRSRSASKRLASSLLASTSRTKPHAPQRRRIHQVDSSRLVPPNWVHHVRTARRAIHKPTDVWIGRTGETPKRCLKLPDSRVHALSLARTQRSGNEHQTAYASGGASSRANVDATGRRLLRRCSATALQLAAAAHRLLYMTHPPNDPTTPDREAHAGGSGRPTVDEMSEWSFPASDPPASWTWDVVKPPATDESSASSSSASTVRKRPKAPRP